jgi:sarcosine oxidase subunit beta
MPEHPRINGATDVPASADVVVIGAGVNGLATALQLARRGAGTIVVLERRQIGAGATGKSGALVRQHYTNVHESLLTMHSLPTFVNWADEIGFGDPKFQQPGFLRVVSPADEQNLRRNVDAMRAAGVNTWVVTPAEIRELEPLLNVDDISAAAFEPDAGYADPNATMYGLAEAAVAAGVEIHLQTEATSITVEGDRVVAIETSRGRISTRRVLVAAGVWADRLLDPIGVELGMTPYKSQVVLFRWPMEMDQSRKHRVVIDTVNQSWLRPEGDALTLIGIEFPDRTADPDAYPEFPPIDYIEATRAALSARFPVFERATMRGGWTGMYMMSADHHPIIGAVDEIEGLYLMAGDSGSSFKTAPATGVCLAELMTEGRSSLVDLTPFRPGRFRDGQPWVDEFRYGLAGEELSISR